MTRGYFLGLVACSVLAQPIPPPASLSASHAATGANVASPGSFIRLFLTGLTNVKLDERRRLRIEFQSKDSPQVFTAEAVEPPTDTDENDVWAIVPDEMPSGEAYIYLLVDGMRHLTAVISVVPAAPGIFTANYRGYGPALASLENGSTLNGLTRPAVAGQLVTLWATGLGASPWEAVVELAGFAIVPEFSGHNPVIDGLDQINVRLPQEAPLGCYVPIAIRVRDRLSNVVALSIGGDPGACPHPLPLAYSELSALDAGESIDSAWLSVNSVSPSPDRPEGVSFDFRILDSDAVFKFSGLQLTDEQYHACPPQDRDFTNTGYTPFYPDAGPSVNFAGPQGKLITLPAGAYSRTLRPPDGPYSAPGPWLLSVPGGNDIAGFQQAFWLPPAIRGAARQESDTGATISWDPSGYIPGDVMRITIYPDLTCRVPAWVGRVTMPASGIVILELEPHPAARPKFRVPRSDGTTIVGIGDYRFRTTITH
jgi:hypothetical protein